MSLTKGINMPGFTFKSLLQQWKIWEPTLRKNPISDSKSLRHTVNLAIEHDRTMNNIPLIRMLYTMYILLPLSTASCERGFSSMNYIKSKRRNKLQENALRYCVIISNHRWADGALNFRAIADEIYMSLKNRLEPKRYTLDELMESLQNNKKRKTKLGSKKRNSYITWKSPIMSLFYRKPLIQRENYDRASRQMTRCCGERLLIAASRVLDRKLARLITSPQSLLL